MRVDLDAVHAVARAHGATINDVVLAAVTAALGDLLRQPRRERRPPRRLDPDLLPIDGDSHELGNAVGVLPVDIPLVGELDRRVAEIARLTRSRKDSSASRGSSAALLGPLFRAMAQLGLLRWFMDHQHLINTLVTNVHGPDERLAFAGTTIRSVTPISIVTGNVTVAFAVLSYAKTLTITINSDADECPDLDRLTDLVRDTLTHMTGTRRSPRRPDQPRNKSVVDRPPGIGSPCEGPEISIPGPACFR